jgi:hypothetical protein
VAPPGSGRACPCQTAGRPGGVPRIGLQSEDRDLPEWKAVYGRIEARDTVPARARIGGLLEELLVAEGDAVTAGQRIAVVRDDKIGFIALAGIIVRNSILLVDFARHAPREAMDGIGARHLIEILIEAGAIRFKPILLTALAAMIGAAVILTDPIVQGLALSLLFGLASSTLLTVLVIPAIYRVFRT